MPLRDAGAGCADERPIKKFRQCWRHCEQDSHPQRHDRERAETHGCITRRQEGTQARTQASRRAGGRAGGRAGRNWQAGSRALAGRRAGRQTPRSARRQASRHVKRRAHMIGLCPDVTHKSRCIGTRERGGTPRAVKAANPNRLRGGGGPLARPRRARREAGAGAGGGAGRPPREVDGEKRRPAPLELALQPQQHLPPRAPHGSEVLPGRFPAPGLACGYPAPRPER